MWVLPYINNQITRNILTILERITNNYRPAYSKPYNIKVNYRIIFYVFTYHIYD